ncbi:competence protein CoiA [Capnocytophaga canimorsus]|uniref:competence protein CoiA n=2 Tax=Capnocytophaga canimorsus TaxID=28188 RepID=UPI0037D9837E
MPLRAYIDGKEIISIELNEDQWKEIKQNIKSEKSILRLPCCNQIGFLRVSRRGLKHFVHSKSKTSCNWKPESPEHLRAKVEIMEACQENGWKAIPEYSESNWRADVLAIQNNKRIAFEVQWSKQTFEETKFRQDRYKASKVRGCWFFQKAPEELEAYLEDENDKHHLRANKEIPAFRIFKGEDSNLMVQLKQSQINLKSFVGHLLKGHFKFCEHITLKSQEITLIFFRTRCWKCKKHQDCWTINRNLTTTCGQRINLGFSNWDDTDIDKSPEIYQAVKQFLQTERGKKLKIGELKRRYSKTVRRNYLSHGCVYCDSIFGDNFLEIEKEEAKHNPKNIKHKVKVVFKNVKQKQEHWCFSENKEFCE